MILGLPFPLSFDQRVVIYYRGNLAIRECPLSGTDNLSNLRF